VSVALSVATHRDVHAPLCLLLYIETLRGLQQKARQEWQPVVRTQHITVVQHDTKHTRMHVVMGTIMTLAEETTGHIQRGNLRLPFPTKIVERHPLQGSICYKLLLPSP